MLSKNMFEKLNNHLSEELFTFHQYLSMSAYCRSISMNGFASWLYTQAQEELAHAMKFFDYINDKNMAVKLQALRQPIVEFQSLTDVFDKVLKSEQNVTKQINTLYAAAIEASDYPTQAFLQWFVTEQIEEEAAAQEIIDSLKLIGDSGHGLFMLDQKVASRPSIAQE